MKTIFEHIEYTKGKPHHIRKKITFMVAVIGTAIIATIWFFGTLSSGTFALQGNTFAESIGEESKTETGVGSDPKGVAGAAAAFLQEQAPAHIEIIDLSTPTNKEKQSEQTILPF
ncbi:MAG: hypothetical protein V1711_00555 [bacterium]